jgi:acyl-CoA synthetase (AMP-forming)/AMP-acid ligase II
VAAGKHYRLREITVRSQAYVTPRTDGQGRKRLVVYVAPRERAAIDAGQLRSRLTKRLVSSVIPAAVTVLPVLPLTTSGKVDHRALPAPVIGAGP